MQTGRTRLAAWRRFGPRARDVAFLALSLADTAGNGVDTAHHHSAGRTTVVVIVGLVATGALWWRRTSPSSVTALTIGSHLLTGSGAAMSIALFTLAIRRRDRHLLALTTAAAFAFALDGPAVISVQAGNSTPTWPSTLVLGVLEAGFLAAAGAFVGARRDLLVTLRERADQAEHERDRRAEQARLAERARIAREMHDVVAHKMSLVALHAGGLEVNPESGRDQVEKTAALIRSTARDALAELRGVLGLLRDIDRDDGSDLSPQPDETDVPRLIEASRAAGLPLELHIQVPDLPAALGRATYRIVQEALTNAHKHARDAATQVSIIGDEASGVSVQVTNRGPVSASTLLPGSGTGLLGLQERVSTLGGRLDSGHTNEGGWRLAAWLPWSAPHRPSGGPA